MPSWRGQAWAAQTWAASLGVLFGLVLAGGLYLALQPPRGEPIQLLPPPLPPPLAVHVAGAVENPGLLSLPSGSRVADAIQAAGGLLPEADEASINLAAQLEDGDQVRVPFKAAAAPAGSPGGSSPTPAPEPGQASSGERSLSPVPFSSGLININTAGVEELDRLPGIGPVIAQRIVDYRTENGQFRTIEAIQEVKGIGPAIFEKIRGLISVS